MSTVSSASLGWRAEPMRCAGFAKHHGLPRGGTSGRYSPSVEENTCGVDFSTFHPPISPLVSPARCASGMKVAWVAIGRYRFSQCRHGYPGSRCGKKTAPLRLRAPVLWTHAPAVLPPMSDLMQERNLACVFASLRHLA